MDVATCKNCHGSHSILPLTDPGLPIHKNKITVFGTRIVNFVKTAYIWIIVISVLSMFAFCTLDLVAKTRRKRKKVPGEGHTEAENSERYFMRFNRVERTLHAIIMVTFFILVYTGLCRSFPDSAFAYPLTKMVPHGVRDWMHRISGVIITLDMIIQFVLFAVTKRGRKQFKALLPKPKDLKDVSDMLKYNTGISKKHPHFGRFSFMEKFEY